MARSLEPRDGIPLKRRQVLSGFVAAYVSSQIPWALAQPASNPDLANFLALSALIVGSRSLDNAQAQRLHTALVADDGDFSANAKSLLGTIEQRKLDATTLQKTLDAEKSPLAAVSRAVATAWFLGVVGRGDRARCIAFETAINALVVADVLKPPTYAYGAYGSWATKPT